jgi:hypothetical protein
MRAMLGMRLQEYANPLHESRKAHETRVNAAWHGASRVFYMKRDTLAEAQKWGDFPVTMIGIFTPDYDTQWDVQIETVVGCSMISREVVRTFASRADAEAFIASEFGIRRQAMDGDDAHDGWWLS